MGLKPQNPKDKTIDQPGKNEAANDMPVSAKALAARVSDASVSSSRRGFSADGLGEMLTTTFGEVGGG